jgi:hypothetical protein
MTLNTPVWGAVQYNMKTNMLHAGMTVCATVLVSALAISARADGQAMAKEKTCAGTITAVDSGERILKINEFLLHRSFVLGDGCVVAVGDNPNAQITDLRPGQKVQVSYKNADGVLVADRVAQEKLRVAGTVRALDTAGGTLSLWDGGHVRTFAIAAQCGVRLNAGRSGALDEIKPGDHVTVTYETPASRWVAYQIERPSRTFVGTLDAIDLPNRMLKASHYLGSERFSMADDCSIMLDGSRDARISDLRLGRQYEFNYDNVDGVNVVNRIAPSEAQTQASASSSPPARPAGQAN